MQVGDTYNIGTQIERTVLSVASDIAKIFNLPESAIVFVRDRAFNDRWVLGASAQLACCCLLFSGRRNVCCAG